MVPAELPPKASFSFDTKGNMDRRNIPQLKSVNVLRPKPHGVSADSTKMQLAPPLTKKAHQILANKTEALMRERDDLDKALLSQASRPLENLRASDWLPRENILIKCERLGRREKKHVQTRQKTLDELTRRYKSDPSTERATDLDLVRELLRKFQIHLGHELGAAEKLKDNDDENEDDDDASSSGAGPSGAQAGAEVASSISRDKDNEHTSEDDSSEGSAGQKPSTTGGLDSAFDDTRLAKKRKHDDLVDSGKGPQKKTRKEQTINDTQASAGLESQPEETAVPEKSQAMAKSIASIKAEIDSISQQTTPKKDTSNKESLGRKANEAPTGKTSSDKGSPEPYFKQFAKDMMRPDFNDHVHESTRRQRRNFKKPTREYVVSGAIGASQALEQINKANQKRQFQSGSQSGSRKARTRRRGFA